MNLPPQLETDLQQLSEQGFAVTAHRPAENGQRIYILFDRYQLPPGWNKDATRLLLITDISYPNSKLDMFWVETNLKLQNGNIPQSADILETHLGETWQRFSWHVQTWNPAHDNLITYLATVDARLRRLE
jgi:hypothetical protein